MKYQVNWNYQAGWQDGKIVLAEGEVVTLDQDIADHVQSDSPGCLTLLDETHGITAPEANRMITADEVTTRKPKQRKDRQPSDPMTSETFKAVKGKPQ